MVLQLLVNRLSETGLCEADDFGPLDSKELFEFGRGEGLDDRIMRKMGQHFGATAFRDVAGEQNEMQLALAAVQCVAPDNEDAGLQNERKQPDDRFGGGGSGHAWRFTRVAKSRGATPGFNISAGPYSCCVADGAARRAQ